MSLKNSEKPSWEDRRTDSHDESATNFSARRGAENRPSTLTPSHNRYGLGHDVCRIPSSDQEYGTWSPKSTLLCDQPYVDEDIRTQIIEWMFEVHVKFTLGSISLHEAVATFDEFLSKRKIASNYVYLLACVCVWITSSLNIKTVRELCNATPEACEFARMHVLKITSPFRNTSPVAFAKRFIKNLGLNHVVEVSEFIDDFVECLIDQMMFDCSFSLQKPRLLGAIAVLFMECILQVHSINDVEIVTKYSVTKLRGGIFALVDVLEFTLKNPKVRVKYETNRKLDKMLSRLESQVRSAIVSGLVSSGYAAITGARVVDPTDQVFGAKYFEEDFQTLFLDMDSDYCQFTFNRSTDNLYILFNNELEPFRFSTFVLDIMNYFLQTKSLSATDDVRAYPMYSDKIGSLDESTSYPNGSPAIPSVPIESSPKKNATGDISIICVEGSYAKTARICVETLASSDPDRRVGVVFYDNKITIVGDGLGTSTGITTIDSAEFCELNNDELSDMGGEFACLEPISASKENLLRCFNDTGGEGTVRAMANAVIICIGMASQNSDCESEVIIIGDRIFMHEEDEKVLEDELQMEEAFEWGRERGVNVTLSSSVADTPRSVYVTEQEMKVSGLEDRFWRDDGGVELLSINSSGYKLHTPEEYSFDAGDFIDVEDFEMRRRWSMSFDAEDEWSDA